MKEYLTIKEVIGYKVAIKLDKKYYSSATGIQYKKGSIESPKFDDFSKKLNKDSVFLPLNLMLRPNSLGFRVEFVKRTAVFKFLDGAKDELRWWKTLGVKNACLLKLTLTDSLVESEYKSHPIVLGQRIKNIIEIKT